MTTVFLINKTLLLLPNQSLSIEYKQFSCHSSITVWLIIHLITSRVAEFIFLTPVVVCLFNIRLLCFYHHRRDSDHSIVRDWVDIRDRNRYSILIIVMKKEFKLILTYGCIAFVSSWLQVINKDYRITYLNIVRWFVESSFLPEMLIITVLDYFLGGDCFEMHYSSFVPMIRMKILFFILMRFIESDSPCTIDRIEKSLFDIYCYRLRK